LLPGGHRLVRSWSGDLKGIVTHDFPLENWEEAFALANSVKSIKVFLKPRQ
jgi:threonine dehydrogenase-like Zn-dependent dehydrogenase